MENEYKAERANVPSRHTLERFRQAYFWLRIDYKLNAKFDLETARDYAINQDEVADIKSVYDLLGEPEKAMERLAELLTRGGRIYDEYSNFLKPNGK